MIYKLVTLRKQCVNQLVFLYLRRILQLRLGLAENYFVKALRARRRGEIGI